MDDNQFGLFWQLFDPDAAFLNRKAATQIEWDKCSAQKRAAIIEWLQQHRPTAGRNPYFFVQDFREPEPEFLSGREQDEYWKADAEKPLCEPLVMVKYNDLFKVCTRQTMLDFNLQYVRNVYPQ